MQKGWVKLHRNLLDWEWYGDVNTCRLFIHLLLKANYKDSRHMGKPVFRGQMITGRIALASETGLSQQTIRTCLDRLKSTGEITIKPTNRFSLVTLVKYDSYQIEENESTSQNAAEQPTTNQQLTINQPTTNQQLTTSKEGKKEKNSNKGKNNTKRFAPCVTDWESWNWPYQASEEIFSAWLNMRKTKKHTVSQLSFKTIGKGLRDSVQQGFTVDQCLTQAENNGWKGLKADWMINSNTQVNGNATTKPRNALERLEEQRRERDAKNAQSRHHGDTLEHYGIPVRNTMDLPARRADNLGEVFDGKLINSERGGQND